MAERIEVSHAAEPVAAEPEPEPQPQPEPIVFNEPAPAPAPAQTFAAAEPAPPAASSSPRKVSLRLPSIELRRNGGNGKARRVVGLKIGASQLAAAVIEENSGRHELVQLVRQPLGAGILGGPDREGRERRGVPRSHGGSLAPGHPQRRPERGRGG